MDRFLFSSIYQPGEDGKIEGLRGVRITPIQDAVHRVAEAMGKVYPLPLTFASMIPYAGSEAALRDILTGMVLSGFADFHVHRFSVPGDGASNVETPPPAEVGPPRGHRIAPAWPTLVSALWYSDEDHGGQLLQLAGRDTHPSPARRRPRARLKRRVSRGNRAAPSGVTWNGWPM